MPTDSAYLIPALFLMTFVLVIVFALFQYRKAKKSRAEHHQSAEARALGERPGERHVSPSGSGSKTAGEQATQRPKPSRS